MSCWKQQLLGSARNTARPEEPAAGKALGLIARSPLCSGMSLGTKCKREYSLPQCLLRLRQQMGLLKHCPAPSPLLLPRCAHRSPQKTRWSRDPPSAASMGVTPPTTGSPQPRTPQPSGHSSRGGCKPRPVVPQLGMQSRCAETFPYTGLFGDNG